MNIRIKKLGVTLNGLDVKPGQIVEVPKGSGTSLVASGHGEVVEAENTSDEASNVTGDANVGSGEESGAGEGNTGTDGAPGDKTPEELEAEALLKLKKAIDEKNTRASLYDEAKTLNIEIAHNIVKADLITKIIENGKYDHLV